MCWGLRPHLNQTMNFAPIMGFSWTKLIRIEGIFEGILQNLIGQNLPEFLIYPKIHSHWMFVQQNQPNLAKKIR